MFQRIVITGLPHPRRAHLHDLHSPAIIRPASHSNLCLFHLSASNIVVSFRLAVVLIIRIHLKNRSTGFHSRCLFWFHYVWRHSVLSARKLTWMATSFTPPTRPPQFFSGTDPISLLSVWKYSYPFLDFTSRDGWKNQQARARVGPRFPLARPLVFRRACSARSGVL